MKQQASNQNQRKNHPFALSVSGLLVAVVFISIFTMAVRIPFSPDTWWHLRAGQYIIENRTIPTTDLFSHSMAGALWIDHGWLAQIFWYGFYALGGWAALALAVAALATLAFWLAWRQIQGNIFVAAFAMILGAVVSSVGWIARPQMLSFVLTAVTAYLLHRFKWRGGRLLPWLPLIMLLWANIHGGFAIGLMLMLAYLLGEALNNLTRHREDPVVSRVGLKHLLLVIALSLAVVVINPHTWRMWLYPFQTVEIGALRDFIQEWQSPDFHLPHAQPFILMLVLLLVALGRAGRRADWTDLALTALWTGWALFAGRNIAIFGLITTPILARYADVAWTRQWETWGYQRVPFASLTTHSTARVSRLTSVVNWLLLGLIIMAAVVKISVPLLPQTSLKVEQESLPYQAVEFIKNRQPPGPMFNNYNWGGYLIFKLWPDYPVYIDGRTDLYDDAFIRRYIDVMTANEGWPQTLDEAGINLVLVETNGTLAKLLKLNSEWAEIYQDNMAIIFVRSRGPSR
ncbi:MAG: hypothetical protein JXM69_21205 [Anaerolineae bacterium]|nr:hypothetical protein [Anaerolineae bacterium]